MKRKNGIRMRKRHNMKCVQDQANNQLNDEQIKCWCPHAFNKNLRNGEPRLKFFNHHPCQCIRFRNNIFIFSPLTSLLHRFSTVFPFTKYCLLLRRVVKIFPLISIYLFVVGVFWQKKIIGRFTECVCQL